MCANIISLYGNADISAYADPSCHNLKNVTAKHSRRNRQVVLVLEVAIAYRRLQETRIRVNAGSILLVSLKSHVACGGKGQCHEWVWRIKKIRSSTSFFVIPITSCGSCIKMPSHKTSIWYISWIHCLVIMSAVCSKINLWVNHFCTHRSGNMATCLDIDK